jgi:predicted murein hydrolase (TIGR00659 family)
MSSFFASPLFGLTLTLVIYILAQMLFVRLGSHPILHPVLISVLLLMAILWWTRIPYNHYFNGGQYLHFLLGPATVALALPLYQQWARLRRLWLPILIALLAGSLVGALSAIGIARLLGLDLQTQLSLAPKSVTTPVAMSITEILGGIPSLTAALVVLTGILGALLGPWLLQRLGFRDESIKGLALGVAAHGIGTARALQLGNQMGAFAGLAMALSALVTALLLPWALKLLGLIG